MGAGAGIGDESTSRKSILREVIVVRRHGDDGSLAARDRRRASSAGPADLHQGARSLGHRRDEHRCGGGTALDRARRAHGRAIDRALGPRVAAVFRAAGGHAPRDRQPLPGPGRNVCVDASRVRPGPRIHLRLVSVGEQSLLFSVAPAFCRGERAAGLRRWFHGSRRQPTLFRHIRADGPLVVRRPQHPGPYCRQVAANRRHARRLGAGRAAHCRRALSP